KSEVAGDGLFLIAPGEQITQFKLVPAPHPESHGEPALELFLRETQIVFGSDRGAPVGAIDPHFRAEKHHGSRPADLELVVEMITVILRGQAARAEGGRQQNGECSEWTRK